MPVLLASCSGPASEPAESRRCSMRPLASRRNVFFSQPPAAGVEELRKEKPLTSAEIWLQSKLAQAKCSRSKCLRHSRLSYVSYERAPRPVQKSDVAGVAPRLLPMLPRSMPSARRDETLCEKMNFHEFEVSRGHALL